MLHTSGQDLVNNALKRSTSKGFIEFLKKIVRGQKNGNTEEQIDLQTEDRQTDRRIDRRIDRRTYRQTDGRTDRHTYIISLCIVYISKCRCVSTINGFKIKF